MCMIICMRMCVWLYMYVLYTYYICMCICLYDYMYFFDKIKTQQSNISCHNKTKMLQEIQSRCDYKPNQPHISEPISLSSNVIIPDFYIFDFQVICTFVHNTWGPLNTFSKTHLWLSYTRRPINIWSYSLVTLPAIQVFNWGISPFFFYRRYCGLNVCVPGKIHTLNP